MKARIENEAGTFSYTPAPEIGHFQLERAANGGWILYPGPPGVGYIPKPPIGAYSTTADLLAALAEVLDKDGD